MRNEEYKENYRRIKIFKIVYKFTKREDEMATIPFTRYFLAFDMSGAIKECVQQYSQGDRRYVEIWTIDDLGYPVGIHHFV